MEISELIKEFKEYEGDLVLDVNLGDEIFFYNVGATEKGLELGINTNFGFKPIELDTVQWDDAFSLDEHLDKLYEIAYADAIMQVA